MLGFSTVIQIIRIEDLIRILVTKSKGSNGNITLVVTWIRTLQNGFR